MLEQIKNISIKGGPFTEKTSFDLFPQRLNLLYGRNGSGKSTMQSKRNIYLSLMKILCRQISE